MTVFERNNSYLFYATKTNPPKPVYFEMNGYDTLLVSYYDKYTIHYHSFEKWDYDPDDDPDVLEIPHCKYNSFCVRGGGEPEATWRFEKCVGTGDGGGGGEGAWEWRILSYTKVDASRSQIS